MLKSSLTFLALGAAFGFLLGVAEAQTQKRAPQQGSCEQTIETHGFLSRGQFQCGFRYYSEDMLGAARACTRQMSDAEAKRWLKSGMEMYDLNEGKRGHEAMCASLLANF